MTTTTPSDLIVKFDAITTNSTAVYTGLGTTELQGLQLGIKLNLQIVEKGPLPSPGTGTVGSTVVGTGTGEFDIENCKDLANIITRYFVDKSILHGATDSDTNPSTTVPNIRSMKLIVNVDPTV